MDFRKIAKSFLFKWVVFLLLINVNQAIYAQEETTALATLVSEKTHLSGNTMFRLGIKIVGSDEEHIYWKNPGDIGSPLVVHWEIPKGFKLKKEYWPKPQVFRDDEFTSFGYQGNVFVIAEIEPTEELNENETYQFGAKVEWLACDQYCSPKNSELQLDLVYSGKESILQTDQAIDFAQAVLSSPRDIKTPIESLVINDKDSSLEFILKGFTLNRVDTALFIPDNLGLSSIYSLDQYTKIKKEVLNLNINLYKKLSDETDIKGVIVFLDKEDKVLDAISIDTNLYQERSVQKPQNDEGISGGFLFILSMAFLGGLLLNIMPCVLPLITLKVYSLMKSAEQSRWVIFTNGLVFTFGVISCFWCLAIVAWILRFLGHNIGWGFHLQEPLFVAILAIIFFLFSLSCLGVFEVGDAITSWCGRLDSVNASSGNSRHITKAFFHGVLATLVTTPCTGPFLGSILGLVMSLSFLKQIGIFSCMGLGMAAPYLVFSISPKLMRILPKPGAWMVTFKQVTGFALMGTVVWFAWIFGAETSVTALSILIGSLFLLALGSWIVGRWGSVIYSKRVRRIAGMSFLIFIFSALLINVVGVLFFDDQPKKIELDNEDREQLVTNIHWQPFSKDKLEEYISKGHPVFVNFTAKWCLTCQVNKPILVSSSMKALFAKYDVVTMEADWTRKDAYITQELLLLGRASVPTYVYYPVNPDRDPVILPQKISQNVLEAVIMEDLKFKK